MQKLLAFTIVLLSVFISCKKNKEKQFLKIPSSTSGIDFKNQLIESSELNILTYLYYYNGAGVAAADFNNDNLIDLYFTANQGEDKLYLNRGNFKFEDITSQSKISNSKMWTTGVTHTDINNDGLLDIYICSVGGYKNMKGKNRLYVNQGNTENGIPVFKEDAASYNLDFSGFSTQASFFDYDLDGDLDMYLLNHSVHPNSTYGKGVQRTRIDSLSGDRLYKNENGKFFDVSTEAKIFQGAIGYGLGIGISDLNNDGYPDIYVGNDFFENDYLYMNQKNGTFKEVISNSTEKLGHTSHFSMGNDLADFNNDGLIDIFSLDMLPEDLQTYKTSGLEFDYPTYQYYLKNGYAPQYMQNTLHLNLGNGNFSEIAELSGIAATEWSWGTLFADYDNDGHKDLFIANGIKGATNDMDYINFIANENIQKRIEKGTTNEDLIFINEMPEKKVSNYFFQNNKDLTFKNVTEDWFQKENSFSNGCVYADLDNDGDLDLVVNNVNEEAYILKNNATKIKNNNFLKLDFVGGKNNTKGIGVKVIATTSNLKIVQENYVSRGYLSSVPSSLNLGIGKDSIIDLLQVIWPGGTYQTIPFVKTNQNLTVFAKNAKGNFYQDQALSSKNYLTQLDTLLNFKHKEIATIEFARDPLVPFANTNEGPAIAIGDFNNDGLEDIFLGGAKTQHSQLFSQNQLGTFDLQTQKNLVLKDNISEDVSSIFFDANSDGYEDLIVVSGGNEFKSGKALRPRLYINNKGVFKKDEKQFSTIQVHASKVSAIDIDNDGDLDLTITSDQVPQQFGVTPQQYIFENDGKGDFSDSTRKFSEAFQNIGNIKDFIWVDLDANGYKDLIVAGHWMPIAIFMNNGNLLELSKKNGLGKTNGWWNTIVADDFDNDGDIDFVAGNWGQNSKFKTGENQPITLYSHDFDKNGTVDPLVTFFYKNIETPLASKDELVKQMPFLNKEFLSYKAFSKASIKDLFSMQNLENVMQKKVYELRSMYYENDGDGNFYGKPLPIIAQASVINDIAVDDFDHDGYKDLLIVGNTYEISTQLGRMDASHGVILKNLENEGFQSFKNQKIDISGPARKIKKINIKDKEHYVITINNGVPIFLAKNEEN